MLSLIPKVGISTSPFVPLLTIIKWFIPLNNIIFVRVRLRNKILPFLLALVLFNSCRKSFETDWDVDIVSPIARGHLNIKNFFSDTLFQSDPTGMLHLAFSKKIAGFALDSLVKIPDTLIVDTFVVIPNFTVTPGMVLPGFPQTQEIPFTINNGVQLRRVVINKGFLKVKYTNTFTQPLTFFLQIPNALKYGVPFTINQTINPGAVGTVVYYDLSSFDIKMTGLSGNKSNAIAQTVVISSPPTAQLAMTQAGQKIKAEISYTKLVPYYVEGYFGQQFVTIPKDSVALNFSKNLQVSNLKINSAAINFKIVNEFGVDINAQLNNIKSINTFSASSVILNAAGLSNLNINRAGKTNNFSSPVFPSIKTVSVNTGNSNLKPFLENLPDYLSFKGNITINPMGNVSGSNDFAFLNTAINIYADVDLPLQIQANYFKLVSNMKADLTGIKQLDNINYGNLILQATNGFPFDAVMQGYILDDKQNIIDSLFSVPGNKIDRGIIDVNNNVTQSVSTKVLIPFDTNKLQNLKRCKTIRFVSRLDLPASPPDVKIYDTYSLDIILSVDVNYRARKK